MPEHEAGSCTCGFCQAQEVGLADTCLSMGEPPSTKSLFQFLKAVRVIILVPILIYVTLFALSVYVAIAALQSKWPRALVEYTIVLAVVILIRLIWLIINGYIQAATASVMNAVKPVSVSGESCSKSSERDRRRWFRLWRWWNRLGTLVLILQVVAACLIIQSNDQLQNGTIKKRLQILFMILPIASLAVVVLGWLTGSEVMSWRSLYTSNDAWKAHYSEAFRSYIRQALCCMCRCHYLSKEQGEEVYSVASLLGELVTYRAEGCSHLEALAGVMLLRNRRETNGGEKKEPVPEHILREASILHQYAVAAYTGPLLELGRYVLFWPIVWLYRQGFCSFWKWSRYCSIPVRRPVLKGDNLWRGHAAAFIRHARLAPEDVLCAGRVLQTERESAYFVVILKELRTIVVAVRGTETLEDLLTDGLSRESNLSDLDLLGLRKGPHVPNEVKRLVEGKHYAHRGIIEAARKLSREIDNLAEDDDDSIAASNATSRLGNKENGSSKRTGLLTELLGPNGSHKNYDLRFVGHSLGGSICALTGLRLYSRYPKLRVYAYGLLPCVDESLAEACQGFITSVVCHDEFASRLSVASIMRLRARALQALSEDTELERGNVYTGLEGEPSSISSTDKSSSRISSMCSSDSHRTLVTGFRTRSPLTLKMKKWSELRKTQRLPYMWKGGVFLCAHTWFCLCKMSQHHKVTVISSEVERYIKSMTSSHEHHKATDTHSEIEMTTRLDPPVPFSLNRVNGDVGSRLTVAEDGHFVVVDMEDGRREDRSDPDWRQTGLPTEMGSGFVNIAGEDAAAKVEELNPVEMYLPGLVVHLDKKEDAADSWRASFWKSWQAERKSEYYAFRVDRKKFKDLVISPSMFIDHMPWKCQYALNHIVGQLKKKEELQTMSSIESQFTPDSSLGKIDSSRSFLKPVSENLSRPA